MKVIEITGDLFQCSTDVCMAHCVSEDLAMSKGIAVLFKNKFGNVNYLISQNKKIGQVAILSDKNRFIYYLITKKRYWEKPTYENLNNCLIELYNHMMINKMKKLAIPRLGCGLDRLNWDTVKRMLEKIFENSDIEISVYSL